MPEIFLTDLFVELPVEVYSSIPGIAVNGVVSDSRKVAVGDLFVAIKGESQDGHQYIQSAIERGAVAVVGSQPLQGLSVPYIRVADSRRSLAFLVAAFHRFPARHLTMIGVTGTDGKTTTANLIFYCLREAGRRAGMISTLSAVVGEEALDTGFHVTTPDAPEVQGYLAKMVTAGMEYAVLEVTSHGLAQHRVDACEFDVGVVTNITHEHLDYHGSYQNYRQAKARLFESLKETRVKTPGILRIAILNRDDESYDFLKELVEKLTGVSSISYGYHPQADVRASDVAHTVSGIHFTVRLKESISPFYSKMVGNYNVSNCLAAISVLVEVLGLPVEAVQKGISQMPDIPGRMERIDLGQDFIAIVDFAHTPNALKNALETARKMTQGRVIALFGSAGLRDRIKRRKMAEVAAELADITLLTAEDPRTESLEMILDEMASGAISCGSVEGKSLWRIPDRRDALHFAVSIAHAGDVVIVCGKGHEQSMCFGEVEYPWDDRLALRAAVSKHLGIPGPEMPDLPVV